MDLAGFANGLDLKERLIKGCLVTLIKVGIQLLTDKALDLVHGVSKLHVVLHLVVK